jgi:cardiolipin synthase
VLLTTGEFAVELVAALAGARRSVALQLMTFDGDRSGLAVAGALQAAARRGVEVRLLVDCFARRFVSDRPVRSPEVWDEHRRTGAMFDELRRSGVELRFTHPNGPGNLFALARNHKKLYLIDDVVYLGGINVSDHNFAWHDFMVRIVDPVVHRAVIADFDASFEGRRLQTEEPIVTGRAVARKLDELVAGARQRIVIASPYAMDRRLAGRMEACPARHKTLIVAPRNNFWCQRLVTPYLADRMSRAGVQLADYGRFSHAKFVLVDEDTLLIGSSNFGRHSLFCNNEIGLVIRDRDFIAHFERTMLSDLTPVALRGQRSRRWCGLVSSALIDGYLIIYARAIAPLVPPLARSPRPGRRRGLLRWRRR